MWTWPLWRWVMVVEGLAVLERSAWGSGLEYKIQSWINIMNYCVRLTPSVSLSLSSWLLARTSGSLLAAVVVAVPVHYLLTDFLLGAACSAARKMLIFPDICPSVRFTSHPGSRRTNGDHSL